MTPGSPEWLKLVTASKVPAILGLSPWESPRSLWHKMHGDLPDQTQTDAQARGHYLEPAILAWWSDRHKPAGTWSYQDQPTYTLGDWAAATPDRVAHLDGVANDATCIVEAKSTSRDDDWGTPGTDEIPLYYFVQVQWQMHVSGIHRCYVPMIGPRLQFAEYIVDYLPDDAAILERRCREFYDSLTADQPPPLDDTKATFEAVKRVHSDDYDHGTEVVVPEPVAVELAQAVADKKAADARERLAKSTVLDLMDRAQFATCDGLKVARRQGANGAFVAVAKPEHFTSKEDAA